MKYIVKAQVKPYTRTRKGKMERVGGYSRIGEPYDTREKKYAQPKEGSIEKINGKWKIARTVMVEVKREKWLPEVQWTDPKPEDIPAVKARAQQRAETIVAGHKVRQEIARKIQEQKQARKEMAEAKGEEGVKGVLKRWGTALFGKYDLPSWTKIGEPFEVNKPLRHIEIETKSGMKRTDEWKIKEALKENSNTENPPKYLNAKWKKDINKELHEISTTYHSFFPSDKIFDSLKKRGVVVLQEDGTEFSGFFLGENAQTTFQLAPIGAKISTINTATDKEGYSGAGITGVDIRYRPFKNTALVMGWYKMPSGKYEMTTYVG